MERRKKVGKDGRNAKARSVRKGDRMKEV